MHAFEQQFQDDLVDLMSWRRDVRRFRMDAVPGDVLETCLDAMRLAPSVGLSEPWRILSVESDAARAHALANFEAANEMALQGYSDDRAARYAGLKLSGMREAPVQLAVFCDDETQKGSGLGAATMPEMRRYSVVGAVMNFWLRARALGLGVGWVSILDPNRLSADLAAPSGWSLIAYLCVGWPEEDHLEPELSRAGWERRSERLMMEVR